MQEGLATVQLMNHIFNIIQRCKQDLFQINWKTYFYKKPFCTEFEAYTGVEFFLKKIAFDQTEGNYKNKLKKTSSRNKKDMHCFFEEKKRLQSSCVFVRDTDMDLFMRDTNMDPCTR